MTHLLSESARVIVDPKTIEAAEKPLSYQKKKELQREAVKQLIRKTPYGQRLKLGEGSITKHNIGVASFFYTVNEPVVVTHPADKIREKITDLPAPNQNGNFDDLEHKAQRFSWAYPDNHNDLREFVKWYRSQL